MAYKYDVFLSYYRSDENHANWVDNTFYSLFKTFLSDALNKKVEVFKDTNDILSGQEWNMKIREGLIHSKIMIPIFSPGYFRSEWCKKELAVMDYRQISCGYMSAANPDGIVVPMRVRDGEFFPGSVTSRMQIRDFNDCFRVGIEINKPPIFYKFQDQLDSWVKDVAYAYNKAPDWNDDWKQDRWINDAWVNLNRFDTIKNNAAPTL